MKTKLCYLMAAVVLALGSPQSLHPQACVAASKVTLTGNLRAANGLPASNTTLTLTPTQVGFISGCGVNLPIANACATSTDGSVVGVSNPTTATTVTSAGGGSLPGDIYYVEYTFFDAAGNETLPSPETVATLGITGSIVVASPASGLPGSAVGMNVYIATSSGSETKQGSATGTAAYTQSSALISGTALPASNTTLCQVTANDAVWPTGTGYKVSMVDSDGNAIPGYPMTWQLMGAGNTINLANGLPYYNGVVTYPVPILASPFNHATQSISGGLAFGGYFLYNVGKLGIGTSTPGFPIDVENGAINSSGGYIFNGGSGVSTGNCLLADSDQFHTFRVPGTCFTSLSGIFYQSVAVDNSFQTPRATLNFSNLFIATDSASPAETTIDLRPIVTAATCLNPRSIAFNATGQVTNCTAGTGTGITQSMTITGLCTASGGSYNICTSGPFAWPTPFADSNYSPACSGTAPTNGTGPSGSISGDIYSITKTATGVTLFLQTVTSSGFSYTSVECIAVHH